MYAFILSALVANIGQAIRKDYAPKKSQALPKRWPTDGEPKGYEPITLSLITRLLPMTKHWYDDLSLLALGVLIGVLGAEVIGLFILNAMLPYRP